MVYGNALSQMSYEAYKKCEVIGLPKKYGRSQMGYTVPKNSSFRGALAYYTQQMIESGTVDRMKAIYEYEDQVCPSYEGKALGLHKCFLLFALVLIGTGLGLILLLLELCLPTKWYEAIHSIGDGLFQGALEGVSMNNTEHWEEHWADMSG